MRISPVVRTLLVGIMLGASWALSGTRSLSAETQPVCGPSPSVKSALDQLPQYPTPSQTGWQYDELRQSAIQVLLKQYPDDVFVQRASVRSRLYPDTDREKAMAEYKAFHEQRPDDARMDYLYALTLVGRDSPQAIKLLTSALEKDPSFELPRLELVQIYSSPNFMDKAQSSAQAKAFVSACPDTFDGYEPLARMDDRALIAEGAKKLKAAIGSRTDPEALGAYSTLWSLEFKATPPSEYDALRKQVAADLSHIRALNLVNERHWYEALTEGYKLVKNQKESDWAEDEDARLFPSPYNLISCTKWEKEHQYPADDAPADQKQAYYTELLKQTDEWVKDRPNTPYIWMERLDALEHLDSSSASDVEACIDRALQVAEANAGPQPVASYTYVGVAEVLSRKHLQPDREAEMAQKGLDRLEAESKQPPYDLYATPKDVDDQNFYNSTQRAQALYYEADGYLQLSQPDKAQAALGQLDDRLQQLKSQAGDKDDRRKSLAGQESGYWGGMARLAELQNRKVDGMAYYESALLARLDSGQVPVAGEKDELQDGARQLWASLGGTDDGWKMWYTRRADALAQQSHLTWETANDPLPSFELTDLKGKTWQLADLRGKVIFLNFWASW